MTAVACLLLLLVAAAVAVPGPAPTPPNLARQFTSNFVMRFGQRNAEDVPPPDPVFSGFLAVDDVNYGFFANFSGEELLPIYFRTNLVLSPSDSGSTLYWFEDEICVKSPNVPSTIFQFFPLRIPKTAKFVGRSTINGTAVTSWGFNFTVHALSFNAPAYCTIYAAATPQAGGTAVVQVFITSILGERNIGITFEFTDTTTGPFSPSIYAPPAISSCNMPKSKLSPLDMLFAMALTYSS